MQTSNSIESGHRIPSPRRIKQEAKRIRLQSPTIKQHQALDLAARARGWASYRALERAWRAKNRSLAHIVTLSARWFDQGGSGGQMHAHVPLIEPWDHHLPLALRRSIYTLGKFHISRGDRAHLVARQSFSSWLTCVHNLSKAARQLVFVDAMRVHPASVAQMVKAYGGDPYKVLTDRYPNQDHESLWCDPRTGYHFILNEPYQVDLDRQRPVLEARRMLTHTTRDWTIHNPQGTLAQLIAPSADMQSFEHLVQRSLFLPDRFARIEFTDESGERVAVFDRP